MSNIPWFLNGKPQRDDYPLTADVILGALGSVPQTVQNFKTDSHRNLPSLLSPMTSQILPLAEDIRRVKRISRMSKSECLEYLQTLRARKEQEDTRTRGIESLITQLETKTKEIGQYQSKLQALYSEAASRRSLLQRLRYRPEESTFLLTEPQQEQVTRVQEALNGLQVMAIHITQEIYSKSIYLSTGLYGPKIQDTLKRVFAGDATYVIGIEFGFTVCCRELSLTTSQSIKECEQRIATIDGASRQRVETNRAKNAKFAHHKAMAAAYLGLSRAQAKVVKRLLKERQYDSCPYCEGPLDENIHADHIYPVSLGGLSTEQNMVLVCADCNCRKSNKTLREFCLEARLDFQSIERRLMELGKKF